LGKQLLGGPASASDRHLCLLPTTKEACHSSILFIDGNFLIPRLLTVMSLGQIKIIMAII
jgi:hypothetical protein